MKKKAIVVFRIVSVLIVICCLCFIYRWYKNNQINSHIQYEMEKFVTAEDLDDESLKINFKKLKEINSDTVGWVRVNNTGIDYPVVQYSDNDYYLKHNFYKDENSAGWIFADCENSFDTLDKNTIVYGHHMRNGSMFGDLPHLLDDSWNFENKNSYFYFSTEEKSYRAEIFSVYSMKISELVIPNKFDNDEEFFKYIQQLEDLSIKDFNVQINNDDNIITLCTCGSTNKYRVVVHAKLTELK